MEGQVFEKWFEKNFVQNKSDQQMTGRLSKWEFIWILKPDFVQQLILLLLQMSYYEFNFINL